MSASGILVRSHGEARHILAFVQTGVRRAASCLPDEAAARASLLFDGHNPGIVELQPIASARNNARAAQNFLVMQPPDLSEVREALSCVVVDTDRAGDIVDRIRDHIKKTPPRKERFDLNEAINEIIVLGRPLLCERHRRPILLSKVV
jgi:hypothetical protein